MRIKLLNTELGIGVCNAEDVPAWATKHGPAAEVAFFLLSSERLDRPE